MVQLTRPKVGTSTEAKILHSLHETGSLLIGDFFLPSYIIKCVQVAEGLAPTQKILIAAEAMKRGSDDDLIKKMMAGIDDTTKWAASIRGEEYHQINILCFLSEWAAQESGLENTIAAIIQTIKPAAISVASKFAKGRYKIENWPWSDSECLEIAQKLDSKAKEKTPDGGWDIASRLVVLFGWLGVMLKIPPDNAGKYNEASMIRNVMLHRYGKLGSSEIRRSPHLSEWLGKTLLITQQRVTEYHNAIISMHLAIFTAIRSNGLK